MDDRTLRAHVFAYTQQTCEVAQWLASQVSDSQAWAQTEPLDYIVHDLVSAAEEVQERQIPVPWRINIACLRAATNRTLVADAYASRADTDHASNVTHSWFADRLHFIHGIFSTCFVEPRNATRIIPEVAVDEAEISIVPANMYALLPRKQEVVSTDDVDVDLQRYMAGEELKAETRGPNDDMAMEAMRSELPDIPPYFGGEIKTYSNILHEVDSLVTDRDLGLMSLSYAVDAILERFPVIFIRGINVNAPKTRVYLQVHEELLVRQQALDSTSAEKRGEIGETLHLVKDLSEIVDGLDQAFVLCIKEREELAAAKTGKHRKRALNKKLRSIPEDLKPSQDHNITPNAAEVIRGAFHQAFSSSADDSGLRFMTDDPRFQRISASRIIRGAIDNNEKVNILMLAMLIHLSIKFPTDLSGIQRPVDEDTFLEQVQENVAGMNESLLAAIECTNANNELLLSFIGNTERLLRVLDQFVMLKEPFTVYTRSLCANVGTMVYVHERYLTVVNRLFETWSFGYMVHLYHASRATDRIEENRVFAELLKAYQKPLMLDSVTGQPSFEQAALNFRGRSRVPSSRDLVPSAAPIERDFFRSFPRIAYTAETRYEQMIQAFTGKSTAGSAMAQWRKDVKESGLEEPVKMMRTFKDHFRHHLQGDFPTAQLDLAAIYCDVIKVGRTMVDTFSLRASEGDPKFRLVHEGAMEALKWLDHHRSTGLTKTKLRDSMWEYPVTHAFQAKGPESLRRLQSR